MDAAHGPPWAPGLAHLTRAIPAVPCRARARLEDFEVEEQLGFEPSGAGEHLYLWIEKRALTTDELVAGLARASGRPRSALGFAGRKDRQAVARQWVSVEGLSEEAARAFELPGARVLRAVRHERKLRLGQLAGNRFLLRLVELADADRPRLAQVFEELARAGVPNWFGPQRFGASGRAFELGRLLVAGDLRGYVLALCGPLHGGDGPAVSELRAAVESGSRSALKRCASHVPPELARLARQLERRRGDFASALRAVGRDLPRMHVSALQSLVFNAVLGRRLAGQPAGPSELVAGDLAFEHATGRTLAVEEPSELAGRAARFELSPSGPLPGTRAEFAAGAPGALERELAAREGCAPERMALDGLAFDAPGDRRPLRVPLLEPTLAFEEGAARLGFGLPPGSYATAVLEEIRKEHHPAPA